MKSSDNKLAFCWVILGVIGRLIPHIPNFTPMTSLSLFAGSKLSRATAFMTLFFALLVSDILLAIINGYPVFSYWTLFSYSGFAIMVLAGSKLNANNSLTKTAIYITSSSAGFWLWTNFGVWLTSGLYSKNIVGLFNCYIAAIPFLRNEMVGDIVWGLVVFGAFSVAHKRVLHAQS